MFCAEMVKRFEVVSNQGRRSILQLMLPWLRNVELVDDNLRHHVVSCFEETAAVSSSSPCNPLLKGTGWGSLEGSQLVLHNLVYLTAKVCTCALCCVTFAAIAYCTGRTLYCVLIKHACFATMCSHGLCVQFW